MLTLRVQADATDFRVVERVVAMVHLGLVDAVEVDTVGVGMAIHKRIWERVVEVPVSSFNSAQRPA